MSDIKLKPCPFCGGHARIHLIYLGAEHVFTVECNKCGIITPRKPTEEKAVITWNQRAGEQHE